MKDIIKALKENKKPFGLMSEELRHAMVCDFIKDDIEYYQGPAWVGKDEDKGFGGFALDKTYRLRADYTEDEYELCEITELGENLVFNYNGRHWSITEAFQFARFDGFRFQDIYDDEPQKEPWLRLDKHHDGNYKMTHATHVVFKK